MNSFYSPEELKSLGLKEYGENVQRPSFSTLASWALQHIYAFPRRHSFSRENCKKNAPQAMAVRAARTYIHAFMV